MPLSSPCCLLRRPPLSILGSSRDRAQTSLSAQCVVTAQPDLISKQVAYFSGRGRLIVEFPGPVPGKVLSFVGMHLGVVNANPNVWVSVPSVVAVVMDVVWLDFAGTGVALPAVGVACGCLLLFDACCFLLLLVLIVVVCCCLLFVYFGVRCFSGTFWSGSLGCVLAVVRERSVSFPKPCPLVQVDSLALVGVIRSWHSFVCILDAYKCPRVCVFDANLCLLAVFTPGSFRHGRSALVASRSLSTPPMPLCSRLVWFCVFADFLALLVFVLFCCNLVI